MRRSLPTILSIIVVLSLEKTRGDVARSKTEPIKSCPKPTKTNLGSSCLERLGEFPLTAEDLQTLEKNRLTVDTQPCASNRALTCLKTNAPSLIGAGTFGLVVRGRSSSVHFPLAVKFIKLPAKLDTVSFNIQGRYNQIDLDSLKKNAGKEKSLREAAALRLLTDYEVPSVPRYVSDLETSSYRILAMEFLDGFNELSKIIDQLSSKELMFISCHVSAIVCNLDRISLSHDDMHERNILIDQRNGNQVYLIDFGGAQFHGHFTSASNLLKQPINLLGHLKRLVKDDLIDQIQSEEKKTVGQFCAQMEKFVSNDKDSMLFSHRRLFDKHWPMTQTRKKLFKCSFDWFKGNNFKMK